MAGFKLVTNVEPEAGLQLAWRAAQDLGFKLTPIKDAVFHATKGSTVWTMVVGGAALHCNFKLSAHRYADGTTDVVLERNGSWLTGGLLGQRRSRAEADALMEKVATAIEQTGGKVVERKEI